MQPPRVKENNAVIGYTYVAIGWPRVCAPLALSPRCMSTVARQRGTIPAESRYNVTHCSWIMCRTCGSQPGGPGQRVQRRSAARPDPIRAAAQVRSRHGVDWSRRCPRAEYCGSRYFRVMPWRSTPIIPCNVVATTKRLQIAVQVRFTCAGISPTTVACTDGGV